jgi:ribosomal protein S18 acetylase RimI-like enzyme
MITVRKSTFDDNKDFAELVLISAPFFPILFSGRIRVILQDLFCYRSNLFSFEHVHFAEVDGEKAGMILGYDWQIKKQENLRSGFLLFKKIGVNILGKFLSLIKFNATVGRVYDGEYYICNIATYPKYRRMGVGKN